MTAHPGWYADPDNSAQQRYWDGTGWTEHRHPTPGPAAVVPVAAIIPVPPQYAPPSFTPAYRPAQQMAVHAAPGGIATSPAGHPISSGGKRFGGLMMDTLLSVLLMITFIGYFIWSMIAWTRGQTPGKAVLGMVVVDVHTGQRVGWGRMFLRQFVGIGLLSMMTLGITYVVSCFMIATDVRKQGIWDKIAGTLVVDAVSANLR